MQKSLQTKTTISVFHSSTTTLSPLSAAKPILRRHLRSGSGNLIGESACQHNECGTSAAAGAPHVGFLPLRLRPPLWRGHLRSPLRRVAGVLLIRHRLLTTSAVTSAVADDDGGLLFHRELHRARAQLRSGIRVPVAVPISLPGRQRQRRISWMDSQGKIRNN